LIPAGGKKQLTATFSPDHDSDFFSDLVRITISEQVGFEEKRKQEIILNKNIFF
jgi:hypothetical protein